MLKPEGDIKIKINFVCVSVKIGKDLHTEKKQRQLVGGGKGRRRRKSAESDAGVCDERLRTGREDEWDFCSRRQKLICHVTRKMAATRKRLFNEKTREKGE